MNTSLAAFGRALVIGLVVWLITLAGYDSTLGKIIWTIPLVAFAMGYRTRANPFLIGVGLVTLPLAIAGYTAPRGDEDGLWILIFPFLVVLGVVAIVAAAVGEVVRVRYGSTVSRWMRSLR